MSQRESLNLVDMEIYVYAVVLNDNEADMFLFDSPTEANTFVNKQRESSPLDTMKVYDLSVVVKKQHEMNLDHLKYWK